MPDYGSGTACVPRGEDPKKKKDAARIQMASRIAGVAPFVCGCGEGYPSEDEAWRCKKCRTYLTEPDFRNRTVLDVFRGVKVDENGNETDVRHRVV